MATFSVVKKDQYKECPRCGATLFSDMEICYGCMFNFAAAEALAPSSQETLDEPELIGEYVEDETLQQKNFFCTLKVSFWSNKPLFFSSKQLQNLQDGFGKTSVEVEEVSFSLSDTTQTI